MGTKRNMKRKTARRAYMPKANMGKSMDGFTYGAGDGDISPRDANMESMARGGGLMGFRNGGGVMDGMEKASSYKRGGTKTGMKRKTARRAYVKK